MLKQIVMVFKGILVAGALTGLSWQQLSAQPCNPLADPRAIVMDENARFTLLTPRLIRMEWSRNSQFEDRASIVFINRKLPVPEFQTYREGDWLIIQTGELTLKYKSGTGRFHSKNLLITFKMEGVSKSWHPGKPNQANLKGTAFSLDDHNGAFHRDTGKPLQMMDGLISRDGWAFIDDSGTPVFDTSAWPWAAPRADPNTQDFYFVAYGNDYKAALYDFVRAAGHIPLPPKFAFGVWWSRYWEYTDQDLRDLAEAYARYQLPLQVMVVDMDWHITTLPEFFENGKRKRTPGGKKMGWTGFTWNRNYFPAPEEFLKWMHDHGIAVGLNLHLDAGILPHEERYQELARALAMDLATPTPIPFNLFDKSFVEKFFDIILHPLEQQGVDFWWLDWQNWDTGSIPGLNTQFWLNHIFYTHSTSADERPMILSRFAGLGSHRYPIGFSGDASISWQSLDFQPYFTATAANVAYCYWSHDIGGHTRGESAPELYTRWVQFGVFSPIFRTHATKSEKIERRFWAYPLPYYQAMKKAVQLRAQLLPYIYTTAYNAYQNGISICYPLYYDYPQREEAYQFRNQYFFGDRLLVHPITHPIGTDSLFTFQTSWLPPGEWIEWETGTVLKGNRIVHRPFTLDEIPVYAKAGAILPMQPYPSANDLIKSNRLILTVFPGGSDSLLLYDDDGSTLAYQNGGYALIPVKSLQSEDELTIIVEPVQGKFRGMNKRRAYKVRLPLSCPPTAVRLNGELLPYQRYPADSCWTYAGDAVETRIFTPARGVHRLVEIRVTFEQDCNRQSLSGIKAKIHRLKALARFLAAHGWDRARYSNDLVVRSAQLGLRLSQQPEQFNSVLESFEHDWKHILAMLESVQQEDPAFRPYWTLLKNSN